MRKAGAHGGLAPGKVTVELDDGTREAFDHAILTCGGQAAALLVDDGEKGWAERFAFSLIRYAPERTVLHTDQSFIPADPKQRRCFNYARLTHTLQTSMNALHVAATEH